MDPENPPPAEAPRGANPVPEPSTLALAGIGMVVLAVHLARRRRAALA